MAPRGKPTPSEYCADASVAEDSESEQECANVSPATSSQRKSASSSTGTPAARPKKQQLLRVHGSTTRHVLGGGRGSSKKRVPGTAGNGKAPVWYHRHWEAVDQKAYPARVTESAELRRRLNKDNALMRCLHCKEQRRYNPCTYFRTHLIQACEVFKTKENSIALIVRRRWLTTTVVRCDRSRSMFGT